MFASPHSGNAAFLQDAVSLQSFIALDAEFVGVGPHAMEHALARVSLVAPIYHPSTPSAPNLCVVYDSYVAVDQPVTDYRTYVSGIRAENLANAPSFAAVRQRVMSLLQGRVLVGHSVFNDLAVLRIVHPSTQIRDTQTFPPLQQLAASSLPSLRNLVRCLFRDADFQSGEHNSVEDARMALRIYLIHAPIWECLLGSKYQRVFPLAPQQPPRPPVLTQNRLQPPASPPILMQSRPRRAAKQPPPLPPPRSVRPPQRAISAKAQKALAKALAACHLPQPGPKTPPRTRQQVLAAEDAPLTPPCTPPLRQCESVPLPPSDDEDATSSEPLQPLLSRSHRRLAAYRAEQELVAAFPPYSFFPPTPPASPPPSLAPTDTHSISLADGESDEDHVPETPCPSPSRTRRRRKRRQDWLVDVDAALFGAMTITDSTPVSAESLVDDVAAPTIAEPVAA